MKNICNNCGKYVDELDGFGYCKKCSDKIFKKSKHTTVEQNKIKSGYKKIFLFFILFACIGCISYFRNDIIKIFSLTLGTSSNPINNVVQSIVPIEDKTLTADNFKSLTDEYMEKNKDSDETYYLSYAMIYHIYKDGISSALNNAFNNVETNENDMYEKMYGKTINQLIQEGKSLMEENNVTIDTYKQSLQNINDIN